MADSVCLDKIPYQLVHRVASACADPDCSPCVFYHLFYDDVEVTCGQMKEFVKDLERWVGEMQLKDVKFIIAATKVRPIEVVPSDLSDLFLRMNEGLFGDMLDTMVYCDGRWKSK